MYFQKPWKSEKPGRNSENLEEISKTFADPENNKFKKLPNFI